MHSTSLFQGGCAAAAFLTIQQTRQDAVLDVTGEGEEEARLGQPQFGEEDLLRIEDEVAGESQGSDQDDSGPRLDCDQPEAGPICKICMSSYTAPLVNTVCWHVHCRTCWLLCLGSKKLCPQCKAIVSPSDLRKIFI